MFLLVLKIARKEPHEKEMLKLLTDLISIFINFKILIGIILGLKAFWKSKVEIMEIVSFLSVGDRKGKRVYV